MACLVSLAGLTDWPSEAIDAYCLLDWAHAIGQETTWSVHFVVVAAADAVMFLAGPEVPDWSSGGDREWAEEVVAVAAEEIGFVLKKEAACPESLAEHEDSLVDAAVIVETVVAAQGT
jgi:hypothetical protein